MHLFLSLFVVQAFAQVIVSDGKITINGANVKNSKCLDGSLTRINNKTYCCHGSGGTTVRNDQVKCNNGTVPEDLSSEEQPSK